MAVKLQSGQHRVLSKPPPAAARPRLWQDRRVDKFAQDLLKYQRRKRCNPREDFLFGALGGLAAGGVSGAVVGAVPGLPLAGVGALATGAIGALAGSALGSLVGVMGGATIALLHVHCHTPDEANLSRHVFSFFDVVPGRHHSRRITRKLVEHKVLYANEARRVMPHSEAQVNAALCEVRVRGRALSKKQCTQVKSILQVQALNTEVTESYQNTEVLS